MALREDDSPPDDLETVNIPVAQWRCCRWSVDESLIRERGCDQIGEVREHGCGSVRYGTGVHVAERMRNTL